jgi:hypothetical protein
MTKRVDMRADVIEHRDEVRLERHGIAFNAKSEGLRTLMRHVRREDGALEQLVRRHVVLDRQAQIHNLLGHAASFLFDGCPWMAPAFGCAAAITAQPLTAALRSKNCQLVIRDPAGQPRNSSRSGFDDHVINVSSKRVAAFVF